MHHTGGVISRTPLQSATVDIGQPFSGRIPQLLALTVFIVAETASLQWNDPRGQVRRAPVLQARNIPQRVNVAKRMLTSNVKEDVDAFIMTSVPLSSVFSRPQRSPPSHPQQAKHPLLQRSLGQGYQPPPPSAERSARYPHPALASPRSPIISGKAKYISTIPPN